MPHICDEQCSSKINLDAAAVALAEASRLLSASLVPGSKWTVETHFASVRIAWMKLTEAANAYRDHLAQA